MHLIMEIYERLVLTLSVNEEVVIPHEFWVKTTVLMTDSVSKNLKIEDGIAVALKQGYQFSGYFQNSGYFFKNSLFWILSVFCLY